MKTSWHDKVEGYTKLAATQHVQSMLDELNQLEETLETYGQGDSSSRVEVILWTVRSDLNWLKVHLKELEDKDGESTLQ